ncbi:hypothetical protein [Fusobacterium sp.]|uniref:hypothetical protein n=1 Tax=Fusobacterium sp. TaxID=68766 RepID=UPI0028FFD2B9|nr:hypothetical protein [Fusobacterium sp.]MDU1912307.1 hypothetical protein [Fusobacterium sp.]
MNIKSKGMDIKLDLVYVGTLRDKESDKKIGIYRIGSSDQIKIDVTESSGFWKI